MRAARRVAMVACVLAWAACGGRGGGGSDAGPGDVAVDSRSDRIANELPDATLDPASDADGWGAAEAADTPADGGDDWRDLAPEWGLDADAAAPDAPPESAPDQASDLAPDQALDFAPDPEDDLALDPAPDSAADADEGADALASDPGGIDQSAEAGEVSPELPGETFGAVDCGNPPLTPPQAGTCEVATGNDWVLLRGDLLVPGGIMKNGHLLIDPAGKIACVACDCSQEPGFEGATRVLCARGLVSPGLINTHDHLAFAASWPKAHGEERYDHRHEWRCGLNDHTGIKTSSVAGAPLWAELRNLIGGATSIFGSGSAAGLLRNLDDQAFAGAGIPGTETGWFDTFPLDDSGCEMLAGSCAYPHIRTSAQAASAWCYAPHVAEGVGPEARNEMVCTATNAGGGQDLMLSNAAFIHGVGVLPPDVGAMARDGTSLIWSPRSNIDLYGNTAPVTLYDTLGVNIALGTDWTPSGSINMVRELRCADAFNRLYLGGHFADRDLVDMATANAARALRLDARIGSLRKGLLADVAVFDASEHEAERAIIDAGPGDVALVLRGGVPVFGSAAVMEGLGAGSCPALDVCGKAKRLCEGGDDFAPAGVYPLFFCDGDPADEPSCTPSRPGEYTGAITADDIDGDGVSNDVDLCPTVFNPPRPADGYVQGDFDGDAVGDACDPCPWDAHETACSAVPTLDPTDPDFDGVPTGTDVCPVTPDKNQADKDQDGKGDACDPCPEAPNPGTAACPPPPAPLRTIYDIKRGLATGRARIEDAIVTGVGGGGVFVQVDPASAGWEGHDYSGLFVYAPTVVAHIGDRATFEGTVQDWWGEIELSKVTASVVQTIEGVVPPEPLVVQPADVATGGSRAVALNGVLVRVEDVTVTDASPPPGGGEPEPTNEFVVAGVLRVDDLLWKADPFPAGGEVFTSLTGVVHFSYQNSKLEPRGPFDIDTVPPPLELKDLSPALSYVPENTSGVPYPTLVVRLNRVADADFEVALESSDPARLVVPPTLVVLAGQSEAVVTVEAHAGGVQTVMLTAAAGDRQATAQVRIVAAGEVPALVAADPPALDMRLGTDASVRVRLDVPAFWGDVVMGASSQPPGVIGHAETVTVPQGQMEGTLVVQPLAAGEAMLALSLDDVTLNVPVKVSEAVPEAPAAPGDVLITEAMVRSQSGTGDTGEWVEVRNMTDRPLDLQGCVLADADTDSHAVAGSVVIAAGAYAVLAASDDPAKNHALPAVAYSWATGGPFVLGNSGDEVIIACGATVIDRVDYASSKVALARSMSLDPDSFGFSENDAAAAWCLGSTPYATSGGVTWYGTPGAPNPQCP